MFIGRFTHTIDSKGRLTVPQRMRNVSAEGDKVLQWVRAVLTLSPQRDSIHLYLEDAWFRLLRTAAGKFPFPNQETQRFQRLAGGYTQPVECDQLGRIVVPQDLKEKAGLEREALWIGATDRAEIWSPDRWNEFIAAHEADYPTLWDELASKSTGEHQHRYHHADLALDTSGAE